MMGMRAASLLAVAMALMAPLPAGAQPGTEYLRGEVLYKDNCDGCHTERMHWRSEKLVTDWNSLKAQVRRWQDNAKLEWNESDVMAVALYLNGRFYSFTVIPGLVMRRPGQSMVAQSAPREMRTAAICSAVPATLPAGDSC
jgi:hypothetical protein